MSEPCHLPHDWFSRPLPGRVALGARSWCYSSYAFLHCQSRPPRTIRIGHDTGVYHGTFFDLGPRGEVEIGNYCTLVGAILCTNGRVVIGDYCFLAHEVVLTDNPFATPDHADARPGGPADIFLGENCWVGMRAVIVGPVRIGTGAIVGAAAVVDFDVPPFAIVAGNPASIVGWAQSRD
jgi:acetyltransferase-like isoleucine patch superfamily enzyme